MKINDLELYRVSMAQTECSTAVHSLLVRLTTRTGLEGWGESGLSWRVGELTARREALLAVLEGRSIYDIEELQTLDAIGPAPLRSAIEMAVWDVLGRTLRQPLCNLLGGYYRRRVPVSMRHVSRPASQAAAVARELAEQGFHTQTIVAGDYPEDDLRALESIREMVGSALELRFDGLGRYDLETARDLAAGMEAHDVQFFLDPLGAAGLHPLASLGRQTSVPLAAWRAIRGPADALTAVRCNAAAYLVIDTDQVGGIVPARICAAIAAAGGATPILGSRPSVGIATAAMLHVASATAALASGNELCPGQLSDSVLSDPLEVTDGMMTAPQSFGLGITVDRAKIEKYQSL
jgi:muconate cycloisomerase